MKDKKILVCDDDEMILKIITQMLISEGCEVHTAINGSKAIEKINESKFDLILSDILMPHYNGLEIIQLIKTSSTNKETPIIVLSQMGVENTVMKAFELGAIDFITKPFSPKELLFRIKLNIAKKQ